MEKFSRTFRGYEPEEVNQFLDGVIKQVEEILAENKNLVLEVQKRDHKIQEIIKENENTLGKLAQYERMEQTLNKAIFMAQKTSEQIKSNAVQESEIILDDAKKNASRIVNEALLRAEKTEAEASLLRRNINIFKRRVKDIVEAQLTVIDEIDKEEL